MEMVKVKRCDVRECAYNANGQCHTLAITVGSGEEHPMCDTFCPSSEKGGVEDTLAGVGACKVSGCAFNSDLECHSQGIEVGHQGNEIDCLTFQSR